MFTVPSLSIYSTDSTGHEKLVVFNTRDEHAVRKMSGIALR
jgi:hypothetical protein